MSNQNPSSSPLKPVAFTIFTGQTLEQVLQREAPPWPNERVVALIQSIAAVLSGLHAQEGTHGGINPRNIRFDDNGRVLLDNFGRFQAADNANATLDRVAARYFTPEQALQDTPNAQSDIYSLGVLTFELLTGKPLFDAETADDILHLHRTAAVPPVSAIRSDLSPALDKVLFRALARDPRSRYHKVRHLADALKDALPTTNPSVDSQDAPPTRIAQAEAMLERQSPQKQVAAQQDIVQQDAPQHPTAQQTHTQQDAPQKKAQVDGLQADAKQKQPQADTPGITMPKVTPISPAVSPAPVSPAPAPKVAPKPAAQPAAAKPVAQPASPQPADSPSLAPVVLPGGAPRPATEIWTPPAPPAPPRRKSGALFGVLAIGVVGLMVWAIQRQPPPRQYTSNPKKLQELRDKYLKTGKMLPNPAQAKDSGMFKDILYKDYIELQMEQYNGMVTKIFAQVAEAQKTANTAGARAASLEEQVKQARKEGNDRAKAMQRQLAAAQAEAARARQAVNSAKSTMAEANRNSNYWKGEYSRVKNLPVPLGDVSGSIP